METPEETAVLFPPTRWVVRPPDPVAAAALRSTLTVTPVTAQVLLNRAMADTAAARRFLDARLEDLSDPEALVDLPLAAARVHAAVAGGERIVVYGDYDADGVTATAILVRGLGTLGGRVRSFVPRRQVEGYGLNAEAIARIGGPGLLIAADCGITAGAEVALARSLGLDVIVLDHHLPQGELPPATAVVDPRRPGQPPVTPFAACGLAYQLVRAVRRLAGRTDEPLDLLDLAAIGTIADVVPLVDDNRLLARHGLLRMAAGPSLGVGSLLAEAGLTGGVTPRDVAFALAPRLNAAGRLDDAAVAVTLLVTDDPGEAQAIARHLDATNRRRQEVCDQVLTEALVQVEDSGAAAGPALVVSGAGWHPGVVGIVASQLRERYGRPVVMIAVEDGVGKGSARSIEALPMVEALAACGDLLLRFGGHAMAAGLTLDAARIDEFRARFIEEAARRLRPEDLIPAVPIDAELTLADLTPDLAGELERLGPYGAGNPEPLFAVRGVRPLAARTVGDGHLRLTLTDGRAVAEAIAFRRADAAEVLAFTGARLDLACTVEVDRWGEQTRVALILHDLQAPGLDLEAVLSDGRLLVERLFERADDYLGDEWRGVEAAGAFYTKVAGVTFEGRQALIPTVRPGQPLRLVREPANPHDPHAVAVRLEDGRQLGYLSARLAGRLAPSMDAGTRYSVTASQVTGGGDLSYGLNVFIQREEGDGPEPSLARAWRDLPDDALLDRIYSHLHPGRHLREVQRAVARRALAGETAVTTLGPGRRGAVTAILVAAALTVRRGAPAALVLPLASQVDEWYEVFAPVLQEVGLRVYRVHGALPLRPRERLARALAEGKVDLVFASAEATRWAALPDDAPVVEIVDPDDAVSSSAGEGGARLRFLWGGEGGPPAGAIDDGYARTHLRVLDRRDHDDLEAILRSVRGEQRALIVTAVATEAVALARRLRGQPEFGPVAYYHGGLPPQVRRILEQLYVDGKIRLLVATAAFPETAAPGDVRLVVVADLPFARAQFLAAAAAAGLDGRPATVALAYRRDAVSRREAALDERFPSRPRLAGLYRALRELGQKGSLGWPDQRLITALAGAGYTPRSIEAGLEVLAEAGVVQREIIEGRWRIELPGDGERRDLTTSRRHAEGRRERDALSALARWASGPASAILRALVGAAPGGPIDAIDAIDA